MSYVRDISLCDFPVGVHVAAVVEKGVLASVTKKAFSDKNANCRLLAEELNESLSEVWMVRPVETSPFPTTVRAPLDELMDRSA